MSSDLDAMILAFRIKQGISKDFVSSFACLPQTRALCEASLACHTAFR